MKACLAAFALLLSPAALGQPPRPVPPEVVEIPSGTLRLKAFLWTPSGTGPFPAVLFNHGRSDGPQQYNRKLTATEAARVLGPVFARHGYVFLHPFRRGEGLSADRGPFIGDLLEREGVAKGEQARTHLQFVLLTTDHLADGRASLAFLKGLRSVDSRRIAVAGHSFGGQLTLLEAERDRTVRAAVTFGAAAGSWARSEEIRSRLLAAIAEITAPLLLLHAANDYSVAPGQAMARELARLSKPHELHVYRPVGETRSDGHNFLYTDVALWEDDVFRFLGEHLER